MAQRAGEWRKNLRTYLAEHIGEALNFDQMFERFRLQIPLAQATRVWLCSHPELGPLDHMRQRVFGVQLHQFPVHCDPPLARGKAYRKVITVTPYHRDCIGCGQPYFAMKSSKHCSASCAAQTNWKRRTMERESADGPRP